MLPTIRSSLGRCIIVFQMIGLDFSEILIKSNKIWTSLITYKFLGRNIEFQSNMPSRQGKGSD